MSSEPTRAPRALSDARGPSAAPLRPGARLDRRPGPRYAARLSFAEIAPSSPLPRAATLARWREGCPPSMVLALVAPRSAIVGPRGPLRFDDGLERGFRWLVEARAALEAKFVVLPTPSSLTTGQRDRDLLAAYADRLRASAPGADVVWAPTGLWEPEQAARQAEALGVVAAFDPLEAHAPRGRIVYARLEAIGARTRFGDALLRAALDALLDAEAEERYVAIASARSFEEASRLDVLARAAGAASAAPRAGAVVEGDAALGDDLDGEDDEDENLDGEEDDFDGAEDEGLDGEDDDLDDDGDADLDGEDDDLDDEDDEAKGR